MIAIVDYDAGNLKSVEKAFAYIGEKAVISRDREEILAADKVVLPGVGSFGDAMRKLEKFHLVNVIYDVIDNGTPFLGICLGLQLLFQRSEECPGIDGLGKLHVAVEKKNVFACQFHPEKSGETGLQILRNFAAL